MSALKNPFERTSQATDAFTQHPRSMLGPIGEQLKKTLKRGQGAVRIETDPVFFMDEDLPDEETIASRDQRRSQWFNEARTTLATFDTLKGASDAIDQNTCLATVKIIKSLAEAGLPSDAYLTPLEETLKTAPTPYLAAAVIQAKLFTGKIEEATTLAVAWVEHPSGVTRDATVDLLERLAEQGIFHKVLATALLTSMEKSIWQFDQFETFKALPRFAALATRFSFPINALLQRLRGYYPRFDDDAARLPCVLTFLAVGDKAQAEDAFAGIKQRDPLIQGHLAFANSPALSQEERDTSLGRGLEYARGGGLIEEYRTFVSAITTSPQATHLLEDGLHNIQTSDPLPHPAVFLYELMAGFHTIQDEEGMEACSQEIQHYTKNHTTFHNELSLASVRAQYLMGQNSSAALEDLISNLFAAPLDRLPRNYANSFSYYARVANALIEMNVDPTPYLQKIKASYLFPADDPRTCSNRLLKLIDLQLAWATKQNTELLKPKPRLRARGSNALS